MTPWIVRDYNAWMTIGQQLSATAFDGRAWQVTVKEFKRDRTLDQNAKCHAMLRDLALFTGYTEKQMKDIAKAEFSPIVHRQIGMKKYGVPKDTSDMTVDEMSAFIERLYQLGTEIGVQWSEQ